MSHDSQHSLYLLAVIVIYDALLCTAREKASIWPQSLSAGSIIYYINRYAIIMALLFLNIDVRTEFLLNKRVSNITSNTADKILTWLARGERTTSKFSRSTNTDTGREISVVACYATTLSLGLAADVSQKGMSFKGMSFNVERRDG